MLHGLCFWGGSRSTKPCVFPCKVAAADDERYLVCATGAAGVVSCANWFLLCVLQRAVVSVRVCSSMRFLKLWLLIALEWLHECCVGYVLGRKPQHEQAAAVFCNSVSASRLLGAVAACIILLSFAADRKSYWSGCIQAAIVICQQIFAILVLAIFLLKILFKKRFKIVFVLLWRRDPVLELQFPTPLRVVLLCFATQCLQIAL